MFDNCGIVSSSKIYRNMSLLIVQCCKTKMNYVNKSCLMWKALKQF